MTKKVQYTARILQPGTNTPSLSLRVGQVFDLALCVKDLRPPGTYTYRGLVKPLIRGVFAAYCDVLFDKSRASFLHLSGTNWTAKDYHKMFAFSPRYANGTLAFDGPDRINELGAFATSFTGTGTAIIEVVRVRMKATKPGELKFTPDVRDLPHPMCDTLLYGNLAADPPEDSYVLSPEEIELVPGVVAVS